MRLPIVLFALFLALAGSATQATGSAVTTWFSMKLWTFRPQSHSDLGSTASFVDSIDLFDKGESEPLRLRLQQHVTG